MGRRGMNKSTEKALTGSESRHGMVSDPIHPCFFWEGWAMPGARMEWHSGHPREICRENQIFLIWEIVIARPWRRILQGEQPWLMDPGQCRVGVPGSGLRCPRGPWSSPQLGLPTIPIRGSILKQCSGIAGSHHNPALCPHKERRLIPLDYSENKGQTPKSFAALQNQLRKGKKPFFPELRSSSSAPLFILKKVKRVDICCKFGSWLYFYFPAPTKVYIYSCSLQGKFYSDYWGESQKGPL